MTAPALILLLIWWLFKTMTIEVDQNELRHWFGPSFWKKHYPIAEISEFKSIKVPWYNGYGIRLIGAGWLYRVSGFEGVEVKLENGSVIVLGTDEPSRLCDALSSFCSLPT